MKKDKRREEAKKPNYKPPKSSPKPPRSYQERQEDVVRKGGIKPKIDYDDDQFYEIIYTLAYQGMTDAEIADGLLDSDLHVFISPDTFNAMKAGRYQSWTEEENAYRSQRMQRVLERARRKINAAVRNKYLKMALGLHKTKNVTTVARRMRIDGELTDNEDIQTSTTEIEYAPSLQAMSVWLHHHDPEWRKREGVVQEDVENDPNVVTESEESIDIEQWIEQESKAKEKKRNDTDNTDTESEVHPSGEGDSPQD